MERVTVTRVYAAGDIDPAEAVALSDVEGCTVLAAFGVWGDDAEESRVFEHIGSWFDGVRFADAVTMLAGRAGESAVYVTRQLVQAELVQAGGV